MSSRREPQVVARLNLDGCRLGKVLSPLEAPSEEELAAFVGWEAPLAPRGAFHLDSGLAAVTESAGTVLEWCGDNLDRSLVTGGEDWRSYSVRALVMPLSEHASSGEDRNDRREALAGIVFRMATSRQYYQFGIEGWRRLVLYRRDDDEWFLLRAEDVAIPDGYVDLLVQLDGDRIDCSALDIRFVAVDYRFRSGKAGFRAVGRCRVSVLEVLQTPGQKRETAVLSKLSRQRTDLLGKDLPEPVLKKVIEISDLRGVPQFSDVREPGIFDMLVSTATETKCLSSEGEVIWTIPTPTSSMSFSDLDPKFGRLICLLAGEGEVQDTTSIWNEDVRMARQKEMLIVSGRDGKILSTAPMPNLDPDVVRMDLCRTGASLTQPGRKDFVLREWRRDIGQAGQRLWTFDSRLRDLWTAWVNVPYGCGDSVQPFDTDKDGRDEILAGGCLLSSTGALIWEHDLAAEVETITGAHHYDAALCGNLSDDIELDPVVFLCAGSAGVYVVDGRTGRTRMAHRLGHAQEMHHGKWRSDLLGAEVLVSCRWGNMGILTLFSGRGDRLWSIQPDHVGEGVCPVLWGDRKTQVLWVNSSKEGMGFYDGYGRRAKDLPALAKIWGDALNRDVQCFAAKAGSDARDCLYMVKGGKLTVFSQG